jgi:hypothetical protein
MDMNGLYRNPEAFVLAYTIVTGGLCGWLVVTVVSHLLDFRRASSTFAPSQPVDPDSSDRDASLPRAALIPIVSMQALAAALFAGATVEFLAGDVPGGLRWATYAFTFFAVLWFLLLFAGVCFPGRVRQAVIHRAHLVLLLAGIVSIAFLSAR